MKNWFSNFIPFEKPFLYKGISYPTVEHFFQAMKTKDQEERLKISKASSPKQAKHFGYKVKLRDDWESIKIKVMLLALRYKFSPGTNWYDKLKDCKEDIVEWNFWHDNFWGHCVCDKCKNEPHLNYLGRLLTYLKENT
jgi:ribA/ribD-fused uncharacterized protein